MIEAVDQLQSVLAGIEQTARDGCSCRAAVQLSQEGIPSRVIGQASQHINEQVEDEPRVRQNDTIACEDMHDGRVQIARRSGRIVIEITVRCGEVRFACGRFKGRHRAIAPNDLHEVRADNFSLRDRTAQRKAFAFVDRQLPRQQVVTVNPRRDRINVGVVTRAPVQLIEVAVAAVQSIRSGTAQELIDAIAAVEIIVAVAADQKVRACQAEDRVIAVAAIEPVVRRVAANVVGQLAADDVFKPAVERQSVAEDINGLPLSRIESKINRDPLHRCGEVERVVAEHIEHRVRASRLEQEQIVSRAAIERVVAKPAIECVVASAAAQPIVAAVSDQPIVERSANGRLNVGERTFESRLHQRCRAIQEVNRQRRREHVLSIEFIESSAAEDQTVERVSIQEADHIVALVEEDIRSQRRQRTGGTLRHLTLESHDIVAVPRVNKKADAQRRRRTQQADRVRSGQRIEIDLFETIVRHDFRFQHR